MSCDKIDHLYESSAFSCSCSWPLTWAGQGFQSHIRSVIFYRIPVPLSDSREIPSSWLPTVLNQIGPTVMLPRPAVILYREKLACNWRGVSADSTHDCREPSKSVDGYGIPGQGFSRMRTGISADSVPIQQSCHEKRFNPSDQACSSEWPGTLQAAKCPFSSDLGAFGPWTDDMSTPSIWQLVLCLIYRTSEP